MKAKLLSAFVLAVLILATGCRRSGPDLPVLRMDPGEAARQADSIRQLVNVQVAPGLDYRLYAVDSLAPDPIALHIDHQGRAYITRTHRQKNSEFDIRGHRQWMIVSNSFETVEDRRAFLRREFAPERSDSNYWLPDLNGDGVRDWRDLAVEQEEVYRIEDTDGDGVADLSRVILRDFADEVADIAGAFYTHGEDMFIGVAPDVWRLKDTSGDGVVDEKTSISHGYGVHIGFSGHNISGLTMGPDGRLYWSIGDIGLNVTGPDGTQWAYPHEGAILRSNLDGSDFEVFATGLRNTHEFVFDAYGNLISVDNDGDHPGEHERLVYIVNGSDSGWRSHWQYGKYSDPTNNLYNVWMEEGMFRPRFEGQTAFITPPLAAYHTGPAGMAYNPGTALGEAWANTFFVAEFTGSPATSRVFGFRLRPSGASFELLDDRQVTQGILATGMDIGPDGALYIADWMEGWGTKDIGRIWKVDVTDDAWAELREETRELLAADFSRRSVEDLSELLRHPDMRVRQKAQFALVDEGASDALYSAARQTQHNLARMHGLWGIWQLARRDPAEAQPLVGFLVDADAEVRAQAARILGDIRHQLAGDHLIPLLRDDAPRVRFFAAEALGRIGHRAAVEPVIQMLAENDDQDAFLRHAGTLALARIGDVEPVLALADNASRSLRIAAVVTLRRLKHPGVARFLADDDVFVVTDAARAINDDGGIEAALPALARILDDPRFANEALLRRAISANLRLGTPESAARLATYARRTEAADTLRADAIASVGVFPGPSVLNRVDGRYLGASQRDTTLAAEAIAPHAEALLTDPSAAVSIATARALGALRYRPAAEPLLDRLRRDRDPRVRIAALESLGQMRSDVLAEAVAVALQDRESAVRMRALQLVPALDSPDSAKAELLAAVVDGGSVAEKQTAVRALGELSDPRVSEILDELLADLESGLLSSEIQLEVIEAVDAKGSAEQQQRLAAYRSALPEDEVLAQYAEALHGGDPSAGGRVYFRHEAAQCARCHAIGGRGGDVGPDLRDIGERLSREELLESLVDPSARIAEGYGQPGSASAMPPMGDILTRRQIRDLVAFLDGLREGISGFRAMRD